MTPEQLSQLDWSKGDGLLPVVVQHARTGQVLMMAFMNRAALSTIGATQSSRSHRVPCGCTERAGDPPT